MLVFQPLQSGGRDVVFEGRPRFLAHRSSKRPLCSYLPICHGISCTCGVTQSRKVRDLIPIIPRTVKVTYAGYMSNDTSVFPVALLENAVTHPIAYQGQE